MLEVSTETGEEHSPFMQKVDRFSDRVQQFFSGVFLSRLTGMGRDLAMAYSFGAHPAVAALLMSFRFTHLFRRFLGEETLQAAFAPYFEGLEAEEKGRGARFFQELVVLSALYLTIFAFLFGVGASLAQKHFSLSSSNREILSFMVCLIPVVIFSSLYALNVAFLQCYRSFFLANMAPALCNVFWIGAALFYRNASILFAMQRVAYAIALGMCLQWLVTFIPVFFKGKSKWKRGLKRRWYVPSREVNRFFQVLFIGAIGVGASQINSFCDSLFARYADLNGPVYLWYAVRFYHLLFTLFGIAMVSTLAPSLSRAFKQKEHDRAKGLFGFGFRSLSVATVIATFALCSLGTPLVDLIFGWGHFSPEAVQKTSFCLIAYGLGLFPASVWLLDSAVCYNQGKWHLPVILSCISVIFNIGCNAFFLFFWQFGVVSIACATSLSAWLQFIGLRLLLSKKGWSPHFLASDLFHWITAGSLACLASEFALSFFSLSSKGAAFFLPALLFGCVIVSYAYLGKNRDLLELLQTYLYWKRGLRGLGKKEWKQMKGKSN